MHNWFPEFLTIVLVHGLAVASPGPDFAVVTQTAIRQGRRVAIVTALGVGTAILWHVALSLAGVSVLFNQSPMLLNGFTVIAAAYLAYLGWGGITAKPLGESAGSESQEQAANAHQGAYIKGLLTNGLNPKATLFFIALFAVVISPERQLIVKLFYGVYMAIATAAWFSLLAWFIGSPKFRSKLREKSHWLERVTGIALWIIAGKLLIDLFAAAG
ncbi:LysE family translocator [Corallincola platygyrae]|uniref:LysE family translocator n=1 Tax=Corallincola platygyrae TaxID=1193278 RepID=A0ABW4XL37_9GAMM